MSASDPQPRAPSAIDGARGALRIYMAVRLLACIPAAAYVSGSSSASGPGLAFWVIFTVASIGGAATLALTFTGWGSRMRPEQTLLPDVIALGALLALSGGAQSQLRHLVLVMMIAPAIVMPPRFVASAGAAVLGAYLAGALPDVLQREPGAFRDAAVYVLGLVWVTGTAVALSAVRVRASRQVDALVDGRQLLLGGILDAEARDRRAITSALHEGALQLLLTARQELDEITPEGEAQRAAVARAENAMQASLASLRDTIAELHPVALDHAGLAAGLRAIVQRAAERSGFEALVVVAPAAEGVRDELVVNVVRELVANVVEHAEARTLAVRVESANGGVVLEIEDDGVGFDPGDRRADAMGLAACAERVAAARGSFAVVSSPGAGTRVRVELGLSEPHLRASA